MSAIITLTTDFGLSDGYAAALKGVILGVNPGATIVDITHSVPAQDIAQAAFVLGTVYDSFPPHTIHIAVVDPGVGTARQAVILLAGPYTFVAPDNGILSWVLKRGKCPSVNRHRVALAPGMQVVAIENTRYMRQPVSSTFHGRDIFAPAAAYLSTGVPLSEFGGELSGLTSLALPEPVREAESSLTGQVIHVDGFGNLITNISEGDLAGDVNRTSVEVGKHLICGINRTYNDGRGLLALVGSSGCLEIALKGGSARKHVRAAVGDKVKVRLNPEAGFRLPI